MSSTPVSSCVSSHVAETSAVALIAELVGPCRVREQSIEGEMVASQVTEAFLCSVSRWATWCSSSWTSATTTMCSSRWAPPCTSCTRSPCPPWTSGRERAVSVTLRHKPGGCLSNCVSYTGKRELCFHLLFCLFVCIRSALSRLFFWVLLTVQPECS